MKNVTTLISMLAILTMLTSIAYAFQYKHIVSFGDGFSDHNGLKTYVPSAPAKRTNGKLWIEIIAYELYATLDNRAIDGAMTSKHRDNEIQAMSDAGDIPQLGLISQVDRYLADSSDVVPEETLFAISIGTNNVIKHILDGSPASAVAQMINDAMADITEAVTKLDDHGARIFILLTIPDLGKCPLFNKRSAEDIQDISQISELFNSHFDSTIFSVIGKSGYQWLTSSLAYLFIPHDNMTDSYMTLDDQFNLTGETNGPVEDYFYWDAIHPTQAPHQAIATMQIENIFGSTTFSYEEVKETIHSERSRWDVKNDGMIGLEEAIHALQISSGLK